MTIILILVLILIAGLILNGIFGYRNDFLKRAGFFMAAASGFLLTIAVVALPISRYVTRAEIYGFLAVKATVEQARKNGEKADRALENAAIQWLAQTKYYNTTIWDIWIPDEIDNIQLIKQKGRRNDAGTKTNVQKLSFPKHGKTCINCGSDREGCLQ